jgi:hypothetical protein|tara:strand:- start:41 stop:604 length:564 start_codon:yes stop_codon:yes gene_type:complete
MEYEQENYVNAPQYHFGEGERNQAELLKYLDPNVQRQKLMIQLFALEWDEKKQLWLQKDKSKVLIRTPKGKSWVENLISPFFTVSTTTNRLKHNQIIRMIHHLVDEIADTLKVRSKRELYGIEIENLREVGNLITRACFLNLSRSSDKGIDVMLLNQNTKFVESRNISQQKSGGFLKGLNPLNALKH